MIFFFFFYPYQYNMDLCNVSCSSVRRTSHKLRLLLSKIHRKKGNSCSFTDCVKKKQNVNVGMHSDVYESI